METTYMYWTENMSLPPPSSLDPFPDNITAPPGNSSEDNMAARRFVYIAEAVVQPCILSIGIITNMISLVVLRRVKMNYIFRTCLIGLAMSDLAACVTGLLALILEIAFFEGEMPFGNWHPNAVVTYFFYYSFMMFMCCSASLVILIAIIRNMFTIAPMKARRYFSPKKTKIACVITFGTAVVLFAPTILNIIFQSCFNETEVEICVRFQTAIPKLQKISTRYLYFLSMLFGPILIIVYTICFICIRVTVGRSIDTLSTMTSSQRVDKRLPRQDSTVSRTKAVSRVTRTLLIILILDVICTLPTIVQGVGLLMAPKSTVFDKTSVSYDMFDVIVEIFLCLRPTYNFWLYVFHHPEFRAKLLPVLTCGKVKAVRRPSVTYRSNSSDYRTEHTFVSNKDNVMSSFRKTSSVRMKEVTSDDIQEF